MELLPEFLFTVVFSLFVAFLFSFVVPVVLSLRSSRDVNDRVGKRTVLYECESGVEPEIHDWGSEIRSGFVGKVVEVDEFVGEEPREENLFVQDFVDESCGSPKGHDGSKTDESQVSMDVGIVSFPRKCVEEESSGGHGGICKVVDESLERPEIGEIEVCFTKNEVGNSESEEVVKASECDGNDHETDGAKESAVDTGLEKDEGLFDEEDDWEGIERSELERLFGAAVAFVGSKSNADRVSSLVSDVKMRLDGLHKIATRGPCFEPQPLAFKLSARAKWNAWQQLGNMSAEVAMEQYIALLSESVPGWMQDVCGDFADAQVLEKVATDLKMMEQNQSGAAEESKVEELKRDVKGLDETGVGVLTH